MAAGATTDGIAVDVGDTVSVRGRLWRVVDTRPDESTSLVTLVPLEPAAGDAITLLHPIDRLERLAPKTRPRWRSRRRAAHEIARLLTTGADADVPTALTLAPAALLPFQIEPLLALRRGLAARLLIADHVGLGKTVQAALIARDLVAARPAATVLVLTPAALRDQWVDELSQRAGVKAAAVDASVLREWTAALPADANPWRTSPVAVASIDFVKQSDVRHGLRRLMWDLLVVDEAHTLTPGSDRLAAASTIAARAARVVLLTATPHDGDQARFRALCALGELTPGEPLAVFRRTREDAGLALERRTRRLAVTPSPAERRVHDYLERYARRVWRDAAAGGGGGARLAMAVLFKRAASSPASLVRSVERRRDLLATGTPAPFQSKLPFAEGEPDDGGDADREPDAVLAAPGLERTHERTWLNLVAHAGRVAARDDRKLQALVRLVRRTREPVIVFTEYRDTLAHVAAALAPIASVATLHGAATPEARRLALAAFDAGRARVLVATDTASEGLNLQRRCRLVVHVELPWTPTRLEQRVGRVDRLGQTRRVHTVHLVGRHTIEARIEAQLMARAARASDALAEATGRRPANTPWDAAADDVEVLGRALTGEHAGREERGRAREVEAPLDWPRLSADAARVSATLSAYRALAAAASRTAGTKRNPGHRRRTTGVAPVAARLPRASARQGTCPGWRFLYRVRLFAGARLADQQVCVVHAAAAGAAVRMRRASQDALAVLQERSRALAMAWSAARCDAVRDAQTRGCAAIARRVRLIREHAAQADRLQQLALFDDRDPCMPEDASGLDDIAEILPASASWRIDVTLAAILAIE